MKHRFLALLFVVAILPASARSQEIRVAVYDDVGVSKGLGNLLQVLAKHPDLNVKQVKAADIRAGILRDVDVLVHPGGTGGGQGKALGEEGREAIRTFVKNGGGYVGICAGAYLASNDYPWSLHILNAKVIDKAHWARGFGAVQITLTKKGRDLLGVKDEKVTIYYHQGPLLAPANDPNIPAYESLGTFATEIAKNGAPKGVMPGTTAIAAATFGKGRVWCFSPHPERTEPLQGMVHCSILWAAAGRDQGTNRTSDRLVKTAQSAETPVTVAASPKAGGHIHPSICRAKDGTLIVVYKGPQVLMCARSSDAGKTWSTPEPIATSAKRPDVIREVKTYEVYPGTADTLPDGRILVTWNYIADDKAKDRYYERALLYTLSSDQGRTWSEQQLIGPVAGKHLGAVRHNVLAWSEGRWLLPLRDGSPRLYDPKSGDLVTFPVKEADGKQHEFQQIVRTSKRTLLALGPVLLRSTDEGKTWAEVKNFPASATARDNLEGRYLTALSDGRMLVTWGVGTANQGLRYNFSADDGQTWSQDAVTLLPETNIAARYYSARTIQVDDQHIGTVYLSGSTVYFLKVSIDRVAKAR